MKPYGDVPFAVISMLSTQFGTTSIKVINYTFTVGKKTTHFRLYLSVTGCIPVEQSLSLA